MKIRAIFSDLDGTMLEPDSSILPEVVAVVARLAEAGVPLCVVTSKTAAEIRLLSEELGLATPAGFENGAGILAVSGAVQLHPAAVPIESLRRVAIRLREVCPSELRTFDELSPEELAKTTGLSDRRLAAARDRIATLPLVVDPTCDRTLERALPDIPRVRVVRGNRFLHLQGRHDKSATVTQLLPDLPGDGEIVTCGDSPNDIGLLAVGDRAVIVPGPTGPHPELAARFPDATVAPLPHGAGWAAAISSLLEARS